MQWSVTMQECVVYLSFPTSNHNLLPDGFFLSLLYIFRFLHQTTTKMDYLLSLPRCISFVSYIKPQLFRGCCNVHVVVYLSFPTSNHNTLAFLNLSDVVVYLSFPTSNHNLPKTESVCSQLYIFRFLHQTTTFSFSSNRIKCCISFVSYIKPQHFLIHTNIVVGCISFVSYIKPQPIVNYCLYINSLCCID